MSHLKPIVPPEAVLYRYIADRLKLPLAKADEVPNWTKVELWREWQDTQEAAMLRAQAEAEAVQEQKPPSAA